MGYEAQKCPGCSGYLPETTDKAMMFAYQADSPDRCYRCDTVLTKQEKYKKNRNPEALVNWPVHSTK